MEVRVRSLAMLFLCLAACGPSVSDYSANVDGGGSGDGGANTPDAYSGPVGVIAGTVWAPGNAPGMVAAGHEFPIYGALVWLSISKPAPVPDQVYCDECVNAPSNAVLSDHKGVFQLQDLVPGTYWLIIQKGQFRLDQQVTVTAGQTLQLQATATTLPSTRDPAAGKFIPRIALASGQYDDMQDIMGKLGIGAVDASGRFVASSAAGIFDVYSNGGAIDNAAMGSLSSLVGDLDKMRNYHIIFIPCSGDQNTSALWNTQVLANIRHYVKEGGKLYVTDWSGEWSDNVFPEQIELRDDPFGDRIDTPANAYNAASDTWNTSMFGNADDLDDYTSDNAEAVDDDLNQWLHEQRGPLATGGQGLFDANNFVVTGAWDHITALNSVQVGTDEKGFPVHDDPKAFVIGDDGTGGGKKPLTVIYEPVGCGRVMYSTYHTTDDTHPGLVPQERILVYLIMEIGVCHSGPVID